MSALQRDLKRVTVAAFLLCVLWPATRLAAQPAAGSVGGSVSAATGIGLPGAVVTAINPEAGVERSVTAGADGEYLIEGLPATGVWEIRAELDGFAPVSRTAFTLTAGGRDTVSFLLMPTTSETLSVTARTAIREQQRGTIQQIVTDRLAHSLPLIGRDFITGFLETIAGRLVAVAFPFLSPKVALCPINFGRPESLNYPVFHIKCRTIKLPQFTNQ